MEEERRCGAVMSVSVFSSLLSVSVFTLLLSVSRRGEEKEIEEDPLPLSTLLPPPTFSPLLSVSMRTPFWSVSVFTSVLSVSRREEEKV